MQEVIFSNYDVFVPLKCTLCLFEEGKAKNELFLSEISLILSREIK